MEKKEETKKGLVIYLLRTLTIALVISFTLSKIITSYIFVTAYIPSNSMYDTLNVGDKIVVNIIGTKLGTIERGDIIVFNPPEGVTDKDYFIKRVIGLPGETVEIKEGIVYINGKELKEDYLYSNTDSNYGPYNVPEDSYFVLGDNRASSYDARFWSNSYVSRERVVGRAIMKLNKDFTKIETPKYDFQ